MVGHLARNHQHHLDLTDYSLLDTVLLAQLSVTPPYLGLQSHQRERTERIEGMSFLSTKLVTALPSAARLQTLNKLRTTIFGTTYNPESLRTGSKILKARLRGPTMLRYYGERMSGWAALNAQVPGLELPDVVEETR